MRGLRRGIGLYINEVSSPSYRREVQRLASKGKLAVVVSDDSLAFGVNMPFRTCVFAGEMGGELTPLMAQQMSGRAGRRGLDTQGSFVQCLLYLLYLLHCLYTRVVWVLYLSVYLFIYKNTYLSIYPSICRTIFSVYSCLILTYFDSVISLLFWALLILLHPL